MCEFSVPENPWHKEFLQLSSQTKAQSRTGNLRETPECLTDKKLNPSFRLTQFMYKRKQLNHQGRVRRPFYQPGQDKEHPFVRGAEIKLAAVGERHRESPCKQGGLKKKKLKGELQSRKVGVKPLVSEEEMDTPLHQPNLLSTNKATLAEC